MSPPSAAATEAAAGAAPAAAGLLVVTVDRLPAWMLPACGATWVATPAIDSLAARGILFDRLIVAATDPAETLHDLAGGGDPDGPSPLRAATTLGWNPLLVTDDADTAARFTAAFGMQATVVAAAAKTAEARDDAETDLARLASAAVGAVRSGRHRLVWCHVTSLGVAWDAPRRHRDRYVDPEDPPPPAGAGVPSFAVDADTDPDLIMGLRQVFAGQVSLLDAEIGPLLDAAAAARWAVLFTGVRGMPLGLHGWVGVGGPDVAYGELIHVPAILADTDGRMAAQRFGGLVVPADLGSTLAEIVTGAASKAASPDPAAPWRGVSLAGLFHDWSAAARDRVVVVGAESVAVVTPAWHCLAGRAAAGPPRIRLFAKPDDFFECNDVADRCRDVAEPLADLIEREGRGDGAFFGRGLWLVDLPDAAPG